MDEFQTGLTFSKRERIGIFTLGFLILLTAIVLRLLPERSDTYSNAELSNISEQLDSLFEEKSNHNSKYKNKKANTEIWAKRSTQKFATPKSPTITNFERDSITKLDPNIASVEQLIQIGIPEKVAQTLDNFRSKGGKLFKAQDILKIYGFQESLFQKLKNQIVIPKKAWPVRVKTQPSKTSKPAIDLAPIDVNLANEEELQQISGIGPFFARKIVQRRTDLGGYYSISQLTEVDKLSDSILINLQPALTISNIIKKIDINKSSQFQLTRHPYFTKDQAKKILHHRDFNLKLRNWKELATILQITPNEVEKIKQYFNI